MKPFFPLRGALKLATALLAPALALGLTVTAQAQTPVALYTCDQSSGSTLTNTGSLGTAKNATISGTAAFATGKVGTYCMSLNGSTYAYNASALVAGNSSFTAAAWVKLNNLSSYQGILAVQGTNVSCFYLEFDGSAGKFSLTRFASDSTSAATTSAVATAAPTAGTWYHVAGVYNSTAKTLALYVNGTLQQSVAFTKGWNATGQTLIGRTMWGGSATSYLNGYLDDVRLYQSALTAAQVTALYALGGTTTTSYTLTTSAGTGGTVSPSGTTSYTSGTIVSVTATPSSGYTFSGWSGATTGTTNPVSITMDANKTLTASFTSSGGTTATYYTWPAYSPCPAYDYVDEFGTIAQPTSVADDCTGVAGTYTSGWWCFRYGSTKNSLVTSASWIPMLTRLNTDFAYITDTMRWPRDGRVRNGNYSGVYLYGSGLCTDSAANTDLGGWQGWVGNGPIILASYYPVYSFDPACTYSDKTAQQSAMVHEGIHCILSTMTGCQNACWFNEGGNCWLQGTMEAKRTGSYSSMGFLSAAMAIAPFQPIECYSGWLQDGTFGGPCAEGGVNKTNSSGAQVCTWKNLLGGSQYGEAFPHALEVILGEKSIAWCWRYCNASGRVLQDLAEVSGGIGTTQIRRLIKEFRGRQAFGDFGNWSSAYKALLDANWGISIKEEWSPYNVACTPWVASCYVDSTLSGTTLTPAAWTLPGWSGANQIPLTVSSTATSASVTLNSTASNMSLQLVYKDTSGNILYSTPVGNGETASIPLSNVKNNVIVAVVCNTDYIYTGTSILSTKYSYTLGLGSGVSGKALITTQWYNN